MDEHEQAGTLRGSLGQRVALPPVAARGGKELMGDLDTYSHGGGSSSVTTALKCHNNSNGLIDRYN